MVVGGGGLWQWGVLLAGDGWRHLMASVAPEFWPRSNFLEFSVNILNGKQIRIFAFAWLSFFGKKT